MEQYETVYEEKSSVINIPVEIDIRELEQALNEQLRGALYEDNDLKDGDRMMIRAEKRENIRLSIDSNLIKYRVPLKLWIKYDLGISKVEADGLLTLDFRTSFEITRDWQVRTLTEIASHEWAQKPRLRMGVVNLPIGFIADMVLKNSRAVISRNIDELVKEQFNLRTLVEDAWSQMFQPLLISEEYSTWLTVNPQLIGMTPLSMRGQYIRSNIFVEGQPRVRVGREPEHLRPAPLPPLQVRQEVGEGFTLHLNTDITYEEAERIAKLQLLNETFSQGKHSVTINNIELYGQGTQMVVNIGLRGSYNGSIYLIGTPTYDPRRNSIDIDDLEYTLDTRNFLMRSAGWLLKSTIKKKIAENMNFLLDYNLKEMQAQFQEQLRDYKISEGISLRGELRELGIQHAYLRPESIAVELVLKGRVNVDVKGLH
jgi:hypothetical protein